MICLFYSIIAPKTKKTAHIVVTFKKSPIFAFAKAGCASTKEYRMVSSSIGNINKRKYPVGIQSFESIRTGGYVYVDKTPLLYKMITEGKPYFLSRPRRFGKSLMVDTLACIFVGRRELFEAFTTEDGTEQPQLFIATTNWKWEKHPVLRFDFSAGDLESIEQLDALIDYMLGEYEKKYGITPARTDANIRFINLIREAERQTGQKVVVLVDEYDNMVLHSLGDAEKQKIVRQRFQNLFGPLESEDVHLQFVFITGISKFSQMGVFSKLNQLVNISMVPVFDTVCGISEEELVTTLRADIEMLGQKKGLTFEEMFAVLKENYDGYHFSEAMTDMYNPFSLIKAFSFEKVDDYWFSSGTPGALIDMLVQMPPIDLIDIDGKECQSSDFDLSFDSYSSPLPILYQSGYLTIKQYDAELESYTLGFPNLEVRKGFADCLYQYVEHGRAQVDMNKSSLFLAYKRFRRDGELAEFIEAIKTFFAGIPYHIEKGNGNEHYYHALLYTLLMSFGADLRCEDASAKGRSDITLLMPKGIYILELKYDRPVQDALDQIDRNGYADKYRLDGRPITKVGIVFSEKERNISEWEAVGV